MSLPTKSTWHILKGTWFVYQSGTSIIHVQLKNNGMQYAYVDGELVNEIRSLKLRTEQKFEHNGNHYLIRTVPANKAMTSFETELVVNDVLLKVFQFSYRTEIKRFLPFILIIFTLTIPMVLMELPTWSLYAMVAVAVAAKIFVFNKDMFEIVEKDNSIDVNI